ncbi:glycosyltransferase [Leuconostoc pseudomesenteroides]|uniref:glycosyltransferase n=1 Tax=Leuconostoc pseudomesenteroides TaxID=33968 RepID=UPI0039E75304
MKTKVLIIIPRLGGNGGTETVLLFWQKYFSNHSDVNLTFMAPQGLRATAYDRPISKIIEPVSKIPLPVQRLLMIPRVLWALNKNQYDDVICTTSKLIKMVAILRKVCMPKHRHFRLVSWIHSSLYDEPSIAISDLQYADAHLAISSGIISQMQQNKITGKKYLIFNPIPESKTDGLSSVSVANDHRKIVKFVYIGRIMWKGQKNLAELFTALDKVSGNWQLEIFGTGDAVEIDRVNNFVSNHQLAKHVIMRGWVARPFDNLECDYLVLTSKYEGLPMVLIEAQQHGIACISANCPTGPDDIITLDSGYLYEPGDIDQLSGILQQCIDAPTVPFDPRKIQALSSRFAEDAYFEKVERSLSMINTSNRKC